MTILHESYVGGLRFELSTSGLKTKQTKWLVCLAKARISLVIRPVWSVFAVRSVGSLAPKVSSCGQRKLWSDCATDRSLQYFETYLLFKVVRLIKLHLVNHNVQQSLKYYSQASVESKRSFRKLQCIRPAEDASLFLWKSYCMLSNVWRKGQVLLWIEPPHDKTNKMTVHPAKTRISLGNRPVWSESSLCAHWVAKDPSCLHADSEDSDQTGRMPRLIWVFAGCISHIVGFVMRRLNFFWFLWKKS